MTKSIAPVESAIKRGVWSSKSGEVRINFVINPETADPVGEQQHGIEHLFQDGAPVDIVEFFRGCHHGPKTLGKFRRNLIQPAPVVTTVINDVQAIFSGAARRGLPGAVDYRECATIPRKPVRCDAAVGEKVTTPAGGEMNNMGAAKRRPAWGRFPEGEAWPRSSLRLVSLLPLGRNRATSRRVRSSESAAGSR